MTHTHHTHYVNRGFKKAAIVTAEYPDGTVDLVYFNGGPDGTPHAATHVRHDALGSEGTFYHNSEFATSLDSYEDDAKAEVTEREEKTKARAEAVAKSQAEAGEKARLERAKVRARDREYTDAEKEADAKADAEIANPVVPLHIEAPTKPLNYPEQPDTMDHPVPPANPVPPVEKEIL
jgi:hypothetical protein